jgi:hypothetical protein
VEGGRREVLRSLCQISNATTLNLEVSVQAVLACWRFQGSNTLAVGLKEMALRNNTCTHTTKLHVLQHDSTQQYHQPSAYVFDALHLDHTCQLLKVLDSISLYMFATPFVQVSFVAGSEEAAWTLVPASASASASSSFTHQGQQGENESLRCNSTHADSFTLISFWCTWMLAVPLVTPAATVQWHNLVVLSYPTCMHALSAVSLWPQTCVPAQVPPASWR